MKRNYSPGILFMLAGCLALCPLAGLKADGTNSAANPPEKKNGLTLIAAKDAAKLVADKQVTVLDVRMPAEFASGHIAGATNLDIYNKEFKSKLEQLDKAKPYLVHCAMGMRSAKACKLMSQEGFKNVYDLKGGLDAWKKAGMPIEK